MMQFDLDEHDHMMELSYKGTDGESHTIVADVVAANKMLIASYTQHPDDLDAQEQILIEWAEKHGGHALSERHVFLLGHYILEAYGEFKKKASDTLSSLRPTESTPSYFQQLNAGRLKLAGTESTPNENSESESQPPTSPPAASTA